MGKLIETAGNIAALLGILLCAVSGIARVAGYFHVVGFESMTMFVGGIGLMVAACLAKLQAMAQKR